MSDKNETSARSEADRERDPFTAEVLALIPSMRAYATALSGSLDRADDVVQDALINAFRARDQFTPGTNLRAWLFRIVRNRFLNVIQRGKREVEDADGVYAARLATQPRQEADLRYAELLAALQGLRPEHRDALVLVASGADYEEIAEISGVPVGTVKSRIHRGRRELLAVLGEGPRLVSPGRRPARAPKASARRQTGLAA